MNWDFKTKFKNNISIKMFNNNILNKKKNN